MKKAIKDQPVTYGQMEQALDGQLDKVSKMLQGQTEALKRYVNDRIESSEKSMVHTMTQNMGQMMEEKLKYHLAEHHESMVEAIEEIVIKDRIAPLEKRVGKLEHKMA